MYGMFCFAVAVVYVLKELAHSPFGVAFTLLVWGTPIIILRCYFANKNSSCETTAKTITVRQGVFGWRRTFKYKDLSTVAIEYSPLFGKTTWYVYFYTQKAAKKEWPYSAALVGISEADARKLITVLAEKDVDLDVNGIIMSGRI